MSMRLRNRASSGHISASAAHSFAVSKGGVLAQPRSTSEASIASQFGAATRSRIFMVGNGIIPRVRWLALTMLVAACGATQRAGADGGAGSGGAGGAAGDGGQTPDAFAGPWSDFPGG